MAKVEIITRAFNRLEYTVLCVRSIAMYAGMDDYKHIVINQNSTDGTKQWLDSLVKEGHYKLNVIHNETNTGDAGGMKQGIGKTSEDCKYIMQFDNDCMVLTDNFLVNLVKIMDSDDSIGAVMMKRTKVNYVLEPKNVRKICGLNVGDLERATCCTIMRKEVLNDLGIWFTGQKISWGHTVTRVMTEKGMKILKCLDTKVEHVDGADLQVKKYHLYFDGKKGNEFRSNFTRVAY